MAGVALPSEPAAGMKVPDSTAQAYTCIASTTFSFGLTFIRQLFPIGNKEATGRVFIIFLETPKLVEHNRHEDTHMKIGIIGAGAIRQAVARQVLTRGPDALPTNSRGPESPLGIGQQPGARTRAVP